MATSSVSALQTLLIRTVVASDMMGRASTRLEGEVRAGDTAVLTLDDLDLILHWVVANKESRLPSQSAPSGGIRDGHTSCSAMMPETRWACRRLTKTFDFGRRNKVCMRARLLALVTNARARVQIAQKSNTDRDQVFTLGQRVLGWRRQVTIPSTDAHESPAVEVYE